MRLIPTLILTTLLAGAAGAADKPNFIVILADDIGYGDLGPYGATAVKTPNVDRLAREGLRFTDGHCSSGTCTPTRYSLLTGQYAWRKRGTGILPGDAALIIDPAKPTLPSVLQKAGYVTGCVGKWHLGLGDGNLDWNVHIKPGPNEIGFTHAYHMAATGDRVPCVYLENGRVAGLDPADPIRVSYGEKIGGDPTGKENPDLLKMGLTHGHDCTIVNGISRIGYMTGGKAARWKDEDMADTFAREAVKFIEGAKDRPFFLYFATQDIHVPRVPHPRFVGATAMGPRGDSLAQFDFAVGAVLDALDRTGLASNTLVLVTSDNGPVLDDGYADDAVQKLGDHKPGGPFRGTKYSIYEAGTRMPFLVRWPARVKPGVSDALVSQVDLLASFATIAGAERPAGAGPDSQDVSAALLGDSPKGREEFVEHDGGRKIALRRGTWKFIPTPNGGELYDLAKDPAETANVAMQHPEVHAACAARLAELRKAGGDEGLAPPPPPAQKKQKPRAD